MTKLHHIYYYHIWPPPMTKFPWSDKEGLRVHFDKPTGRQNKDYSTQSWLSSGAIPLFRMMELCCSPDFVWFQLDGTTGYTYSISSCVCCESQLWANIKHTDRSKSWILLQSPECLLTLPELQHGFMWYWICTWASWQLHCDLAGCGQIRNTWSAEMIELVQWFFLLWQNDILWNELSSIALPQWSMYVVDNVIGNIPL